MLDPNFELLLKKALNGNSPISPTMCLIPQEAIESVRKHLKMLRHIEHMSNDHLAYTAGCKADGIETALKMLGIKL